MGGLIHTLHFDREESAGPTTYLHGHRPGLAGRSGLRSQGSVNA
jgi:hypothetical protein